MKPILRAWILALLLAAPGASAGAAPAAKAEGASEVVDRLQKRYDTTRDITANVVQEMDVTSFGKKFTSKGKVYFKRPGRMRWEMDDGQRQTIVADGTSLWVYQPSENQVYKAPFDQAFQSTTPVSFLTGIGRIADDFSVAPDGEDETRFYLRLTPRAGEAIGVLRLGVDRRNYDILSAEIHDPIGNITRLQFSDMKRDTGVDDALFVFNVPQGAEVIEAPTQVE